MAAPNLILTGFMGTGKSSVARRLAAQTGRPLYDFDTELVRHFGKPIAQVFAEDGEAAFRAAESALCATLPPDTALIVATGGGVVVNPANREALQARGILICLTADPAAILARVLAEGPIVRPMLGTDPAAAIAGLLAARAPAYAALPHHVDTTSRSVAEVAAAVWACYESVKRET